MSGQLDIDLIKMRSLRVVRDLLWYVLDTIPVLFGRSKVSSDVLLVRIDAIGDFVVWFSSLELLKSHFEGTKIHLVCSPIVVELAKSLNFFDSVTSVEAKRFVRELPYRWRMLRKIRSLGIDTTIQPVYTRILTLGDALVRSSGAAHRIGSVGCPVALSSWRRKMADRIYTKLVPASSVPTMEIERNCEFIEGLFEDQVSPQVSNLPQLVELKEALIFEVDYFIMFPGAASGKRAWPVSKFAAVAKELARVHGYRLVVCGTMGERALADELILKAGVVGAVNLAGETSLSEFVEVVRGASLLVGNETSAVHIAAAVETPSVCLLGGGHYGRFMPYSSSVRGMKPVPVYELMECFGCNWHCIHPDQQRGEAAPCVRGIQVEAVLESAHGILK